MINKKNINVARKIYSKLEKWNFANSSLTKYFGEKKSDYSQETTLIKTLLIDGLYKTNLKDQISVAKHISKIKKLNNRLERGETSVVNDIANWKNTRGKKIYILSFSSKFCHFHNKKFYPIYDSYVCIALKKLVKWKDNKNYKSFKDAINKFKVENNLKDVSFEDMDKYLWIFGMREKLRKGRNDINREIFEAYHNNKELFESL